MTKAQDEVTEALKKLVGPGKPYRTGALLLTYPSTKPGAACQIAMGAVLGALELEHVVDLIQIVKGLRRLADELDARIQQKKPLTQEIRDDDG